MLSIILSLIATNLMWSAGLDIYDIGNLKGHTIYTSDDKGYLLIERIDFGQHGDIYEAREKIGDGKYAADTVVIKMLDYHGDKATTAYLSTAYNAASRISNLAPTVFLQSTFSEVTRGADREAVLVMPKIERTLQQEASSLQSAEDRVRLATETLFLFIEAAKVLTQTGYSHGFINLSDIGRLPGEGLRIFDYDSFSKTGSRIPLVISSDVAPEVARLSVTNAVSDFYSMGVALSQILFRSSQSINKEEAKALFSELKKYTGLSSQAREIQALELFVTASLEENPQQRKNSLLAAVKTIASNDLLPTSKAAELNFTAENIRLQKVTPGFFTTITAVCSDLFSR